MLLSFALVSHTSSITVGSSNTADSVLPTPPAYPTPTSAPDIRSAAASIPKLSFLNIRSSPLERAYPVRASHLASADVYEQGVVVEPGSGRVPSRSNEVCGLAVRQVEDHDPVVDQAARLLVNVLPREHEARAVRGPARLAAERIVGDERVRIGSVRAGEPDLPSSMAGARRDLDEDIPREHHPLAVRRDRAIPAVLEHEGDVPSVDGDLEEVGAIILLALALDVPREADLLSVGAEVWLLESSWLAAGDRGRLARRHVDEHEIDEVVGAALVGGAPVEDGNNLRPVGGPTLGRRASWGVGQLSEIRAVDVRDEDLVVRRASRPCLQEEDVPAGSHGVVPGRVERGEACGQRGDLTGADVDDGVTVDADPGEALPVDGGRWELLSE